MKQQDKLELPNKIYAEAIVRSASGASLLDSTHPITSENVQRFHATGDRREAAIRRLREAGFEVLGQSGISITIAAPPEAYERAFRTTLEAVERPVVKQAGKESTATFINSVDNRPFGEVDISQTAWRELLDGIVINEPIYYFQSSVPSATPPPTAETYLSVPDGVAQGLNATLVHQQGVTGKGVRVVMVDSGWYRHPFFTQHNYNVKVVLAPGATNKDRDECGHGTGESANLLAIAPDVELIVVKSDTDDAGHTKTVNSVAAFEKAISLRPDIISCSWGSDQRNGFLSPQNYRLAACVAEAVRQGIIVIFAAGNGNYGFPAQHREVIAAGGVYLHLDGSLKGKLEASSYASSFISPVYLGRQVPDVCGLVGQLPSGTYILLPVPPGCSVDQNRALRKDGTEMTDGWAAFSGTSAAAPQLAGICALMKQVYPSLSPAEAKRILRQTARDVVDGNSSPFTGAAPARAGPDLATGAGLVDAGAAVNAVKALTNGACCDACASSNQDSLKIYSTPQVRQPMYSQFPKLQKKLDSLLWKFEQELQAAIEANGLEDVELNISEANFSSRSPVTKVAYYLRRTLDDCLNTEGEIDKTKISEEHIGAAQGLLKIGRYQETAINVLTKALLISGASAEIKKVKKLASEALSECGTEIISFDVNSQVMNYSNGVTNEKTMCIKVGTTQMLCSVDGSTQTATCPDGKSYSKGGWTAC